MTVAETADFLGITTARVGKYIAAGKLPAERLGKRQWMLRREDVEAFASRPRKPGRPKKAAPAPEVSE